MRKILQYAILVLLGLNSAYALGNPFKSMSNAVSGCRPSLVRDVANLLPKATDGDVSFHKKVNTMKKCIGTSAATLKKKHADIAKTTASLCGSDKKFASKFPTQCKLAIAANKAIQAEDKAKKDKAKRDKIRKANQPSLFSRMTGSSNNIDPIEPDDDTADIEPVDGRTNNAYGYSSSEVCSPQMPGQMQAPYGMPQAYGPNAPQMPGQMQAPYGMPQAYGQMPYGMTPPPAYGQASAVSQMYGQPPQYPVNQYYGYPQPQGVYPDPAMNGQMPYQQSAWPVAAGSPMSGVQATGQMTGHMVNTPQGPICSCP